MLGDDSSVDYKAQAIAILTIAHHSKDIRIFYKFALSLSQKYKITLIAPKGSNEQIGDISLKILPYKKYRFMIESFHFLKILRPDYLLCIEPLSIIPGILIKKKTGCKLFYDCHEYYPDAFSEKFPDFLKSLMKSLYVFIENRLINSCDGIITVNDDLKHSISKINKNVIVCANYNHMKEEEFCDNKKEFDAIYMGTISSDRGMLKIMEAISNSRTQRPIRVLFLGRFLNRKEEKIFWQVYNYLDLKNYVVFYEYINSADVKEYLRISGCGIAYFDDKNTRLKKAYSIKGFEYMNMGLPIIVNKETVFAKVIEMNKIGESIPYDSAELLSAIYRISDYTLEFRKRISATDNKLIKDNYSWATQEKILLDFFEENSHKKNRLLFFSYFYPPIGGPAVQRPCKFIKYLKKYNWISDVIAVGDIEYLTYDYSLINECCEENLYRTPSLDPSYIYYRFRKREKQSSMIFKGTTEKKKNFIRTLIPVDEKIGWLPFAFLKSLFLCKKRQYDVTIASIGPATSAIAAYIIARLFKLKLIIDYRDHWTLNPYIRMKGLNKIITDTLERRFLKAAQLVIVVSINMKNELIEKFGDHLNEKTMVMYNGWDDDDFKHPLKEETENRIIFSYVGTFAGNRTPEFFLKAMEELISENLIPENMVVRFVGNHKREIMNLMKNKKLENHIEIIPQVEHQNAIDFMLQSDVLLLFIQSKNTLASVTGKLFEYLKVNKPILAMIPPDGEAAQILKKFDHHYITNQENISGIKRLILELLMNYKERKSENPLINYYSRENQAKLVVQRINELF